MRNPPYSTPPSEVDDSDALIRLALDLSWSWNHSSDEIWKRLDPERWQLTGNPWLILQSISRRRLDSLSDDAFRVACVLFYGSDKELFKSQDSYLQDFLLI
jgi:starch phosphorylase